MIYLQVGLYPLNKSEIDVKSLPKRKQDDDLPDVVEPPCPTCGRSANVLLAKGIIKKTTLEDILMLPTIPAPTLSKRKRFPKTVRVLTGMCTKILLS